MILLLAAMQSAVASEPFFGLEWAPLSRQDLVWVDESRTSGLAVGEFDGSVSSNLQAFGGVWFDHRWGLAGTLGYAQWTNETLTDDTVGRRTWAVIRPGVELRVGFHERRLLRPLPYVFLGLHGDIPIVTDRSNAHDEEAQDAIDATLRADAYRLGGFGGRTGFGVDYGVLPGLWLGAVVGLGLHRTAYAGADVDFGTLWVSMDAAFRLTFSWGGPNPPNRDTGAP